MGSYQLLPQNLRVVMVNLAPHGPVAVGIPGLWLRKVRFGEVTLSSLQAL